MADDVKHVLIGTAGHIDHGKTRLIGRLTGLDTDRLPEEKARGISIDLGFADWQAEGFRFGIVDVPGHERFVKNMVAGATGVNLALLVVAADDGVMPQTREHLEIMDLLDIKRGLVAITKTDLVDDELVELVQAEVEDLLEGTFLEGCPIVPVSSETGAGVEELRAALLQVARQVPWGGTHGLVRLPIDRVFSVTGHGTIVTGSMISGEIHTGDTLELLPEGREVRVRSVQNHGVQAAESGARQRTAVNLAGVKTDELCRGQELATPGFLRPTQRLIVELRSLPSSPLVLKDRLELTLHVGTSEVPIRVILKGKQLKPGQRGYAELRVKKPVVASYGQRFILRRISPALTVAGGTVLDPWIPQLKRIKDVDAYAESMDQSSDVDRLSVVLTGKDRVDDSPLEAAWRAGINPDQYSELIETLKADGRLVNAGDKARPVWVHRDRLEAVSRSVMRTIREELKKHQPRRALPRNTLMTACRDIARTELLETVFTFLLKRNELVEVGSNIGPADAQPQLTKNQRQTRDRLLEIIRESGITPPTKKDLAGEVGQKAEQIEPLLNLCVEDGQLVKVSDQLFYAPEALEEARTACTALLQEEGEATMSRLREHWGVSRKFAVPLCEYFDACGVTVRQGDVRVPGPAAEQALTAG